MTLTPEQKAAGWIEWNGGDCPIKDVRTSGLIKMRDGYTWTAPSVLHDCKWKHSGRPYDIIAYRIIEAHGADAEPARPTPFPSSYDDLVFDAVGWSQTIIVDGKLPEWLRDDDLCISHMSLHAFGWPARKWGDDELAIRVRRREPKRETVPCFIVSPARAPFPEINATIDLLDGKPDLSTFKIAEDAL